MIHARGSYAERAASPEDYVDLFVETFGPAVAIRATLADQPQRAATFKQDLLDFARRANQLPPGGAAEYRYDYLLVVARSRDGEKPATPT